MDDCGALASPGALRQAENVRGKRETFFLLRGREHQSAPFFIGIAEGGKDFPANAEIGVAHVGALDGILETEGEAAKGVRGHGQSLRRRVYRKSPGGKQTL